MRTNPSPLPAPVAPMVFVRELQFNDGTKLSLEGTETVVLVGPNNAGKSAALRSISGQLKREGGNLVVTGLTVGRSGTGAEAFTYVANMGRSTGPNAVQVQENNSGYGVSLDECNRAWKGELQNTNIYRFFTQYLRVEDRVGLAHACESFSSLKQGPTRAAHRIFLDDSLEQAISSHFRAAFGCDFVLNRGGGSQIEILCGERPVRAPKEEYYSRSYQEKLSRLQPISEQGDGMRCFAGVVMTVLSAPYSVVLIDEPEAFLHPPQAVQLGRLLAEQQATTRQLLLATHSSDLLRGILNTPTRKVKIVRLQREGDINHVTAMDDAQVRRLWQDPLLRYSNLLDGLFHEKVVICEADADCRFYSAICDALRALAAGSRFPDILFAPVFGKSRSAMALAALRGIGVPTAVALDFDALNDTALLKRLVDIQGGKWATVEGDHKAILEAIKQRSTAVGPWEVRKEVLKREVDLLTSEPFPSDKIRLIRDLVEPPGPWREAKRQGENCLPAGEVLARWKALQGNLEALGIFVAEAGELESWDRTTSASLHGPAWVEKVLQKDLATNPELNAARDFVRRLTGAPV